jgi:hypothetical protein
MCCLSNVVVVKDTVLHEAEKTLGGDTTVHKMSFQKPFCPSAHDYYIIFCVFMQKITF